MTSPLEVADLGGGTACRLVRLLMPNSKAMVTSTLAQWQGPPLCSRAGFYPRRAAIIQDWGAVTDSSHRCVRGNAPRQGVSAPLPDKTLGARLPGVDYGGTARAYASLDVAMAVGTGKSGITRGGGVRSLRCRSRNPSRRKAPAGSGPGCSWRPPAKARTTPLRSPPSVRS